MNELNIKLTIEYNGTPYSGWQSQKNGETIQDIIQDAILKTTGIEIKLTAAGRTDAGVHALGQVANFRIAHHLEAEKYKDALNFYLPDDIRIQKSETVDISFNSRFDALSKIYRYIIGFEKSALYYDYRWEIPEQLNTDVLLESSEFIIGEHDFAPFCVVSSRKENNLCNIETAFWRFENNQAILEIKGNRFLHSMIRSLVGAMVNIARLKQDKNKQNLTLESFRDIIESSTGERVTNTAPAQGLYLVSVQYNKG